MNRKKITKILNKKGKTPITCLTAYSKSVTEIVDKYCDIILVCDSLGMVLYGMKTTREVSLSTMILHTKTVKKFAKKSLVVCDMPFKTYSNKFEAYKNAKKIISASKCDAVKLEGGKRIAKTVKYLTTKGVPVMGHVGLLPQYAKNFKFVGKSLDQKKKIYEDAIALSNSGAFAIVIECTVESLARKITNNVPIPTIGIGASKHCDGQILVTDDIIGLSDFRSRFVKKYFNVKKFIQKSVKKYCNDVKERKFPSSLHVYKF